MNFNLTSFTTPTNNGVYTAGSTTTLDSKLQLISQNATCSKIYCHSSGVVSGTTPTITYKTGVNWSGTSTGCNFCHASGPATNVHGKHIVSYSSSIGCVECHQATVSTNSAIADKSKHVDGINDVAFSAFAGGSWSGTQCSNTYCHSNGSSATGSHPTLSWAGGTINAECSSCHGGNAAAVTKITTSAHGAHVNDAANNKVGFSIGCAACHSATVSSDPRSPALPTM